jgi:TPR repeat protein
MGNEVARYNLGVNEENAGNFDRARKHYIIAARGGNSESLEAVKDLYSMGYATKEDYTKALQLYQVYLGEIKSTQRDKVAAADEENRYY